MAKGGKITRSDVADFNKIVQGFAEMEKAVTRNVDAVIKLNKESKKIEKALKGSGGFKQVADNSKKAADNVKKLTDSEKKLAAQTKKLAFALSEEGKQHALNTEKIRRASAENRKFAKGQLAATKSTFTFKGVLKSFLFTANFMANVMSSLTSAVTRFAKKIITDGIRGVVAFDAAITDVKAVAQATDEQFQKLRDAAIALGGSTKFTAAQVASLQKEFAKLGFVTEDIIFLQESTLKLATATGSELAPAAKVVAGALRSFGRDTKDAAKTAATLAIATTKSALAFEDYETILSTVGNVSKQYGFSLEDTLALLGQLRNANLDASKASTAFRNILLNLADSNGALAKELGGNINTLEGLLDALQQLSDEGINLSEALELTDKRSVNAFLALSKTTKGALALRDGITDVNEELDEMVNVQMEALQNKIILLNSAWQGFVQEVVDVNNGTDKAKGGIDALTTAMQGLTKGVKLENEVFGEFGRIMHSLSNPLLRATAISSFWTNAISELGEETEDVNDDLETLVDNLNNLINIDTNKVKSGFKAIGSAIKDGFTEIFKEAVETGPIIDQVIPIEEIEKNLDEVLGHFDDFQDEALDDFDDFFVGETAISEREFRKQLLAWKIKIREGFQAEDEASEAAKDKQTRDEEQFQQAKLRLIKSLGLAGFDFLSALNDRAFENQQAETNKEIALLDAKQKKELDNEKLTADQRLAIDDKYAADKLKIEEKSQDESLKLRRRSAVIEKAQALFSIGLDTAKGVLKYGSNPITAPLVPFIIGLGIAQAAVVAATPLPKFAKGTDSSPEGPAIVGEKGKELMVDPKGNVSLSPGKSSVMNLEKGTKIIPHDITENLLSPIGMLGGSMDNDKGIIAELQAQNSLLKQISKKPVASSTMTPAGILTSVNKGSTTLKELRKYFS